MDIKELTKLMGDLNKQHKSELFTVLGDPNAKSVDIERVTCGRLSVDIPMGGGVPVGRIIEIYGPESSGKTTIALHIAAAFQSKKQDNAVAFIDYEHAFDKEYARNLGVNIDQLVLSQPTYMEEGLQGVDELIDTGKFSLIIVDSVAAMVPKKELEGEMGASTVGIHARQMSQAMRKLVGKSHKTGTTLIFINQLRDKIGVMFGSPEITTGGNALKFYSSIRIDVRRGAKQKDKGSDEIVSNRGRLKVVKNKTYPPYKESEFDIEFGTGLSRLSDILDYAEMAGIVVKSGSWYHYMDGEEKIKMGQGKPAAISFLEANPEFTDEIETILLDSIV